MDMLDQIPAVNRDSSAATRTVPRVSVVILTFNEESNIADCLKSCDWCDDVHVLDSASTDRTVETALQLGATVHTNSFKSFGRQRNWAIDNIPHKHDWVFHLDADERFTPELVQELRQTVNSDPEEAAYFVPSKLMFLGRWVRRGAGYPVYQVRLFHRDRTRFSDWGHGQREVTKGAIGTLHQPYLHYNFSKGIAEWVEKHNRYSTLEARETLDRLNQPDATLRFFGTPIQRRRFIKERILPRIPAFWLLRFFWMYVVRGGLLDGKAGLYYCLLMSVYQFFIRIKMEEELTQRRRMHRKYTRTIPSARSTTNRTVPTVRTA